MDAKKGLMWGGIILALGVGGFFLWKAYKKKKALRDMQGGTPPVYNPQGSSGSGSSGSGSSGSGSSDDGGSGFDAYGTASSLKATMAGVGTDEDEFWRITNRLSSSEKKKVKDAFPDLKSWIEGDFSFGAETKALNAWGW